MLLFFINKVLLEHTHIYLFTDSMAALLLAEFSSYNKDHMATKTNYIYYLVLYGKTNKKKLDKPHARDVEC